MITILVLPFKNMSADPENAYFCDGLTEDLITQLGQLDIVQVVSRTQSFALQEKGVDTAELRTTHNVTHLLTGSVRRAGYRIRVTAELTDVTTNVAHWTHQEDGDAADIFALQDTISGHLVKKIKAEWMAVERGAAAASATGQRRKVTANGVARKPLPTSETPFIGRAAEIEEIAAKLAHPDCRILTLIGPGGIGKTRLALAAAQATAGNFADSIAFVSLQPVSSVDYYAPALADALGFSLTGQDAPTDQLIRFLHDKAMLIVLDNFEHLLEASAQLIPLLSGAPLVKYLVTTREPLSLQQEWLFPLSGLAFPASDTFSAEEEAAYDAVALFAAWARRVYPEFNLGQEGAAVAHICRLVDGMPLALELAAAWRRSMSCQAIVDEIQDNLEFLTSRLRNVPERHSSIQAIFHQTWQKLTQAEQDVFKHLSIFRGGFQLEAAIQVADADQHILAALVMRSLLRLEANGRYQIHELVRQFAAERLEEDVAEAEEAQARHAAYYMTFLANRRRDVSGGRQREALLEIRTELDNIRVAWRWSVTHRHFQAIEIAGEPLGLYYQFLGGYLEGMKLFSDTIEVLLAQPSAEVIDRALIATLMYQGWYNLRFGQLEAVEKGLSLSQTLYERYNWLPFPGYLSDPAAPLAFVALTRGDYAQAILLAQQMLATEKRREHLINRQFAFHLLSGAYLGQGDFQTAQASAQEAYAISQLTGDRWFRAYILNNLGQIANALDDLKTAKKNYQTSYEIRRDFDDPEGMALALTYLGDIALHENAFKEAEESYERSLTIYEEINDKGGLASAYRGLGIVATGQRDFATAQENYRCALQLVIEISYLPVLFALLVNIADFLWQSGEAERPCRLLAFTANHPASDYETVIRAQHQLELARLAVPPDVYERIIAEGRNAELSGLSNQLLTELSLPYVPAASASIGAADIASRLSSQPLLEPLTPREMDVLQLMARGLSNPEIANELILSVGTVKAYTSKIFGKLGVRNRVEAVSRARELTLVTDP